MRPLNWDLPKLFAKYRTTPQATIADICGVSLHSVSSALREYVRTNPHLREEYEAIGLWHKEYRSGSGKVFRKDWQRVFDLYRTMGLKEIAGLYGCGESTVGHVLRKFIKHNPQFEAEYKLLKHLRYKKANRVLKGAVKRRMAQ